MREGEERRKQRMSGEEEGKKEIEEKGGEGRGGEGRN